jgi:putative nucleotidyltransferase with HDIG domain
VTSRAGATGEPEAPRDDRWLGRPVLSAFVRVAVFAVPIALSIVAATLTAHALPRPRTTAWTIGWWAAVLAVPVLVLRVTDRLARRALPLAVLLKMTMVFPDRAPKRVAVARRSGSTRDLARRVEEAKTRGIDDEPVVAAERILALAGALNAHDRLTRGHGERVRVLTDLIADELDLPADDRDRLRWSALLHDIGKLAVHPHILNKPDKLDDAEWEVIKKHPLEGAKLTAPLAGWLGEWANTIAEHHEKYDGSGYPYGLKGEEISLGGRIVAVADCYDTMTTVRGYKATMTPKAARAELAACAGSHFDPKIVRAFLDVSLGRLRPVAGPLAWLGSLPFVSSIPQAAAVLGRVGAASVVVTGAVTAGALNAEPHRAAPHPTIVALPVGSPSPGPAAGTTGTGTTNGTTLSGLPGSGRGAVSPSTTSTVTGPGGGAGGGGPGGGGPGGTTPTAPMTVPSAPTGVSVVSGNAQVTVSWSAPNDGGSPVTSYTVTPYVAGTSQTPSVFGSTATSQVVGGLSNGTTYTFTVTATNSVGTSSPSSPSIAVTPIASSLEITNGGGLAGRPQKGDQIVVTFSPAPSANAFCSAWSASSSPDLSDSNVVVVGNMPSSGDDTITVTDSGDCTGGFHFGSIDLGQSGYFNSNVTFGGNVMGCKNGKTTGCSTIHWDGQDTLTITLGRESSTQSIQTATSVAVYTPDPALGLSGTISSAKEENF